MSPEQYAFELDDPRGFLGSRSHWPTKAAGRVRAAETFACKFCGLELTRGGNRELRRARAPQGPRVSRGHPLQRRGVFEPRRPSH